MEMLRDVSAELRPLLDAALLAAETSGETAAAERANLGGNAATDYGGGGDDETELAAAAAAADAAAETAAAEAEAEAEARAEASGMRELDALLKLCSSPHKAALLNQLVCGGSVAKAQPKCRDGECDKCGMAALWSRGMRPKVIDEAGNFRADAPVAWKTLLGWERYKSPPKSSSAAPTEEGHQHSEHGGKEAMRQPRSGSIVAALDEFDATNSEIGTASVVRKSFLYLVTPCRSMPRTCYNLAGPQMLNKCLAEPALVEALGRAILWVWLLFHTAAARIARVNWSIHLEVHCLNWHSRALTAVATYTIARDHEQFYLSIDQERC